MDIAEVKSKISPILRTYGVTRASVFGSTARGDATSESDIDLLIEANAPLGVYGLVRLQRDLEEATGRSVDVVTREALNRHIAPLVEPELVSVL